MPPGEGRGGGALTLGRGFNGGGGDGEFGAEGGFEGRRGVREGAGDFIGKSGGGAGAVKIRRSIGVNGDGGVFEGRVSPHGTSDCGDRGLNGDGNGNGWGDRWKYGRGDER